MALPTTRAEFKAYCLRRLGAPVIQINLDDAQIEDRIDEAIYYYAHYHYNGADTVYLPFTVGQAQSGYIDLSSSGNIIGVKRIFRIGTNTMNLLSVDFAVANQAMWQALQGEGMLSYAMLMQYRELIEEMTVGDKPIRYNEHQKRLYIDMNWDILDPSQYIVVEATATVDPSDWPNVWKEKWLQEYATNLIKRNWGEVIKKYNGVQLPGGITLDGKTIFEEANAKIEEMEAAVNDTYMLPSDMFVG